ncbi:leucine-rich repeat domain-containing protein [Jiulongibacter sediminis]|uniref:Uncharacterized protein n=1 Tax=Jiulongibacter sediminis TaxID=1605367 RepID=A0A0P7CB25_9BACT|nr:leucine-rich repeat domain-containing protein [Jiulongibacter sediminis]KPM49949.1 hypothetical protein AFM12_05120 [Jiulongibacter sediminis]TBX26983.1 hypothetical protein TK44_05125 [Jiulongibacter sediminis]
MRLLTVLFLFITVSSYAQVEVMNMYQFEKKNGVVDLSTMRRLRGRRTTFGQWNGPSRNKIWQSLKVFALENGLDFEEYDSDLALNISVEMGPEGFIKSLLYMTRETMEGSSEDTYRVRYDDNYPDGFEEKLRTILFDFAREYRMHSVSLNSEFYPLSYNLKMSERKVEPGAISTLEEAMIVDPLSVKSVDFSNLKLREFPEIIFSFENLEKLDLTQNLLKEVPRKLWKLDNLKYLNLSRNQIGNDDFNFRRNKNLVSLNIQYNRVTEIPDNIHRLRSLSDLLLGNNFLTSLESQKMKAMPSLKTLNLYNAELVRYPEGIETFENLEELDLYYNALNILSPEIAKLQHLKTLAVSNNRLWKLPEELGQLYNLQTLYAHHNKLETLPSLSPSVTYLDIGYNRFQKLPEVIIELPDIYELDISNNRLKEVPEMLKNLEKLENIFLSDNPVQDEPKTKSAFQEFIVDLESRGVNVR